MWTISMEEDPKSFKQIQTGSECINLAKGHSSTIVPTLKRFYYEEKGIIVLKKTQKDSPINV